MSCEPSNRIERIEIHLWDSDGKEYALGINRSQYPSIQALERAFGYMVSLATEQAFPPRTKLDATVGAR